MPEGLEGGSKKLLRDNELEGERVCKADGFYGITYTPTNQSFECLEDLNKFLKEIAKERKGRGKEESKPAVLEPPTSPPTPEERVPQESTNSPTCASPGSDEGSKVEAPVPQSSTSSDSLGKSGSLKRRGNKSARQTPADPPRDYVQRPPRGPSLPIGYHGYRVVPPTYPYASPLYASPVPLPPSGLLSLPVPGPHQHYPFGLQQPLPVPRPYPSTLSQHAPRPSFLPEAPNGSRAPSTSPPPQPSAPSTWEAVAEEEGDPHMQLRPRAKEYVPLRRPGKRPCGSGPDMVRAQGDDAALTGAESPLKLITGGEEELVRSGPPTAAGETQQRAAGSGKGHLQGKEEKEVKGALGQRKGVSSTGEEKLEGAGDALCHVELVESLLDGSCGGVDVPGGQVVGTGPPQCCVCKCPVEKEDEAVDAEGQGTTGGAGGGDLRVHLQCCQAAYHKGCIELWAAICSCSGRSVTCTVCRRETPLEVLLGS